MKQCHFLQRCHLSGLSPVSAADTGLRPLFTYNACISWTKGNRREQSISSQTRSVVTSAVIETRGLGKRYGRRWALSECTLAIPEGMVVGLVGPNGAGKTTLLHLSVGLLAPNAGTIEVLGDRPARGPQQLARVGFVAQDTPTYPTLSVGAHVDLGSWLNPAWNATLADRRLDQLGLDRRQKAGTLSGGQRGQLAR